MTASDETRRKMSLFLSKEGSTRKVCNSIPQAVQNGVAAMSTSGLSGLFNNVVF